MPEWGFEGAAIKTLQNLSTLSHYETKDIEFLKKKKSKIDRKFFNFRKKLGPIKQQELKIPKTLLKSNKLLIVGFP